ncbi:MAG TPA: hypothetical protein VF282_06610 [Bacillota bacterium]
MQIELIPTLEILRDLYARPRDIARFRWYLEQMLGDTDDGDVDVVVPITWANPMGKEHCLAAVQALLDIQAESVAADAAREAGPDLADVDARARLALVLLDDVAGGWTNRWLNEAGYRMCTDPRAQRSNRRRNFVIVPCWASETYTPARIRIEVKAALHRYAHLHRHGMPRTLRDIMVMDGQARAFAGARPALDPDDLAYTAVVIEPHRDSDDFPTQFACLFGDEAARNVGYRPMGLSPYAGFELALREARPDTHNA